MPPPQHHFYSTKYVRHASKMPDSPYKESFAPKAPSPLFSFNFSFNGHLGHSLFLQTSLCFLHYLFVKANYFTKHIFKDAITFALLFVYIHSVFPIF